MSTRSVAKVTWWEGNLHLLQGNLTLFYQLPIELGTNLWLFNPFILGKQIFYMGHLPLWDFILIYTCMKTLIIMYYATDVANWLCLYPTTNPSISCISQMPYLENARNWDTNVFICICKDHDHPYYYEGTPDWMSIPVDIFQNLSI